MRKTRTLRSVPRLKPLAASLAVLLAATAAHDVHAASDRYALRLQQHQTAKTGFPLAVAPRQVTPLRPAGTLAVTSCADDADPGTLRNVLANAVEGDTVDLSQLTCSTITLTQGPIDTSVLGDHHLYDVTLQGPGRGALTIEAGGQSQVFVIGGFSSDQGTFTVNDLTIANGTYSGSLAACVQGFGGALHLNRVDVTNCHSSGTYQLIFGGAVDVNILRMDDSTITSSSATGTGANSTAAGGGAYAGDTILVNSKISGSTTTAPIAVRDGYFSVGGGLYAQGDLTLTNSTISGNSIEATGTDQQARGGGVYVRGIATISGSTIDGNRADGDGGGVFKAIYSIYGEPGGSNPTTSLTVTNSTLSGNASGGRGGGIASSRPLTLDNTTITDNEAALGGGGVQFLLDGVDDASGPLALGSTIVAGNRAGDGATFAAGIDTDATLEVTGANSLVQQAGATITLPDGTLDADPLLLPLAWNGGPTRTHALGTGSPAVDAGNNAAGLEFDQRGEHFARVSGTAADIGAFERQQPPPNDDVIFKDGFDGAAPATFDYAYDDGDGDTNQGPPSSFDPDMLWGNYYLAQPGGEVITRISIAFGPTFPSLANGPVTFWLLQDPDEDFDPRNAYAIASVQGTPKVFNDEFFSVDIPPTWVHGGFFVGASAKLDGGADKPARVDRDASGDKSWFFYAPDIAATIDDLAAAPFGTRNDNPQYVVLPGAFMVRATGTSAP
ncbi:right-handed parallel beta-helix repeat-containing protein [Dokdonella sp.]|uniref:right-handed parallel beta-helix repeat-containing protein n=1 Tax=Dokdonella sp. TaxID=2291710 RepID=UPI001B03B932|nr:right-handed parallel beta-helix repeat-containing protein [Dokdonella sp.]MBO9664168.1 right-handed parallel beta-helix repeat-containing protein [Dokdonella sp.]